MEKTVRSAALEPSTQFLREGELRRGAEFLFLASRSLAAREEKKLADKGMGPAHGRALFMIRQHEGLSVGDLATYLKITNQSLARVLDSLERDGFIERRVDNVDGRIRRLYLTGSGRTLEAELFAIAGDTLLRAYSAVGQEAVGNLWQTLLYVMDSDTRDQLFGSRPKAPTR